MICNKYQSLEGFDRSLYIAKLLHAVQSSDELFEIGEKIIELALVRGFYEKVIFYPEKDNNDAV